MALAILIGVPLGLAAGLNPNSWMDRFGLVTATVGYAIPNFVMGLRLIFIFSVWLDLVPVLDNDFWGHWQAWVLPTVALALPTAAFLARLTRASILEEMQQDYVRTARAKGLRESTIIARHILRNALVPIVTFMGPALAALVGGSYIIESQFGVNGIGVLFVDSIVARDYGVILALTLFYALVIVLANLAVDVLYGFLDPRLNSGSRTV
jgi:oligopeptide transport system permease protein